MSRKVLAPLDESLLGCSWVERGSSPKSPSVNVRRARNPRRSSKAVRIPPCFEAFPTPERGGALIPLGDCLVVRLIEDPTASLGEAGSAWQPAGSAAGAALGGSARSASEEPIREGRVVSVGDGSLQPDGSRRPPTVQEGDRIRFAHSAGSPITWGETTWIILREAEIIPPG